MTGSESIPYFAQSLGWLRGTIERYLRDLREKKHLRTARRGGGKGAVHYDANDFGKIALSFGGPQPSDAAEALEALSPLRLIEQRAIRHGPTSGREADLSGRVLDLRGLHGETLLDWTVRQITAMEDPQIAAEWMAQVGDTWRMVLCMDPPSAVVSWSDSDGTTYTDVFGPPQGKLPYETRKAAHQRARKLTEIPFGAIVTAGSLAAHTAARRRAAGPAPELQLSESDPESSGPEKESAALPGAAPPDQTRLTDATGPLHTPDYALEHMLLQAACDSDRPSGSSLPRGVNHGAPKHRSAYV
jgi:hypothetical protein